MTDGINAAFNSLKIKGAKGQTIDLTKLSGLQVTDKNKSLFAKFDTINKDGKIDEKEAEIMSKTLADIAGNGTISKREIEKAFGKGAYDELTKIASQQNSISKKGVYKEDNVELRSDGTRIETDPKTFHTTEISPNGKVTVKDSRGVLHSTTEVKDGKVVTNEYLDLGYGKTYIKTFDGDGDSKELNHVKIVDKKNNKETIYNTEEDMYNNKPSAVITSANNPIMCQTTTYEYDETGDLLSTETIDSAGDVVETPDDISTDEDVEESDGDSGDDDDDIDDTDDSYEKEDEDEYNRVKSSDEAQGG